MKKKLIRLYNRALATVLGIINRNRIVRYSKRNKLIFLTPETPRMCGGIVRRYYHFLFDLALPLYLLVNKTAPDVTFVLEDVGNFSDLIRRLYPNRIRFDVELEHSDRLEKLVLLGMNPNCVIVKKRDIDGFNNYVLTTFNVAKCQSTNKILLIERLPPKPIFKDNGETAQGGTTRRSIPNHGDVLDTLRSMIRSSFQLQNLQLEKITFEEQLQHFQEAVAVVGQHGAGLSNCIWMNQASTVVEIGSNESLKHYRILCGLKNHDWHLYKTAGPHSWIDPDDFKRWIANNPHLQRFFQPAELPDANA